MVNRNYVRGRAKEYKLMAKYKKKGHFVLRMAGSHGFADLVVINKRDKVIEFIQVKPNNFSESQKNKLMDQCSWLFDEFMVRFKVE